MHFALNAISIALQPNVAALDERGLRAPWPGQVKTGRIMMRLGGVFIFASLLPTIVLAGAPAEAPAGTTALCKDGSYYSNAEKKGACKGHKGIKEWYGSAPVKADAATKPSPPPASPAAQSAPAPAPAAAATPAPAGAKKSAPPQPSATAAAGGGPGMVWANASTKVYHCPGDRWYGKTKEGQYLSEVDAKTKGFKPAHDKACATK
jgi:uncharacterized protein DUF3761